MRGQQTIAGNVRHQQHFSCAGDCLAIGVPEAHQAERTESDQLPAQIEDKKICAVDEPDKATDEEEHGRVESRSGFVVRNVADGVEQYQDADRRAHESEQNAQRIHVQDESKRRIPLKQVELNGLSASDRWHHPDDGGDCRRAGQEGEYSLRSCGAEPRYQNLQRCAQQERARSNKDEGRSCHDLHVERAFYLCDVTLGTGWNSRTILWYIIPLYK